MNLVDLVPLAVILVLLTSLGLLITRSWRWIIVGLAAQYVGAFWLTSLHWPLGLAVVKVIAGWMAGVILGVAMVGSPTAWKSESRFWPSGRVFRLLTAVLVLLVVFAIAPRLETWWPGIQKEQLWGGLILAVMGLLHLGLTAQPLRVAVGLLTLLSGFEVIYASVETSTLVASLLAVVNLGIALAGAYLISAPGLEEPA